MVNLTRRQQQVCDFIKRQQQMTGETPSLREIAQHFGFSSMNAALTHVKALRRKGVLTSEPRQARSLRVISPLQAFRSPLIEVPIYGSIPAGFATDQEEDIRGCVSIDTRSLGAKPNSQLFALEVRGDSMIGRHIMNGDLVLFERSRQARAGDVVAALIDGESTLKTLTVDHGRPVLRAENPKYPKLTPVAELIIQGVMVGLVRRLGSKF